MEYLILFLVLGIVVGVKLDSSTTGSSLSIPACTGMAAGIASSAGCYLGRYQSLNQYDTYPVLQKVSAAVSETQSKLSVATQLLNSIPIPVVQDALVNRLPMAFSDLTIGTNGALSQLSQNVVLMNSSGITMATGMQSEFNRVFNLLQTAIQTKLNAMSAVDVANLNQLIVGANSRNTNSSNADFTKELKVKIASIPSVVEGDLSTVMDLVNQVDTALQQAPSSMTLSSTNLLTTIQGSIANLTSDENEKLAALRTGLETDLTYRVGELKKSVDSLDVTPVLKKGQSDLQGLISDRKSEIDSIISSFNSNISTAGTSWGTALETARNSITTLFNTTSSGESKDYSVIDSAASRLSAELDSVLIPAVTSFDMSANSKLTDLNRLLNETRASLLKSVSSDNSQSVVGGVADTLAKFGSQQQAIQDSIATNYIDNSNAMNELIARMGTNGEMFQRVINELIQKHNALEGISSGGTADVEARWLEAGQTLLNSIQGSMLAAASTVTSMTNEADQTARQADVNASALIDAYNAFTQSQLNISGSSVTSVLASVNHSVNNALKALSDFSDSLAKNRTAFSSQRDAAIASDATASDALHSNYQQASDLIQSALVGLGNRATSTLNAITSVAGAANQSTVSIGLNDGTDYGSELSSYVSKFNAKLGSGNLRTKQGIAQTDSGFNEAMKLLAQKVTSLWTQSTALASAVETQKTRLEADATAAERKLTQDIWSLESRTGELESAVGNQLHFDSIIKPVAKLNRRISEANGTLSTAGSEMKLLSDSLSKQSKDFDSKSQTSVGYINALIASASNAGSVLVAETDALDTALTAAENSLSKNITDLNATTFGQVQAMVAADGLKDAGDAWKVRVTSAKSAEAASEAIESNLTAIGTTAKKLVDSYSTRVFNKTKALATDVQALTGDAGTLLTQLEKSAADLKVRLSEITNTDKAGPVEDMLDSVRDSASLAISDASDSMLGMSQDALDALQGSTSADSVGQSVSDVAGALQDAKDSVGGSWDAVKSIGSVLGAHAKYRAESGNAALSSISANKARMDKLIKDALIKSSDSVTSSLPAPDFTSFVSDIGNRLSAYSKTAASDRTRLVTLAEDVDRGIAGEQSSLGQKLNTVASNTREVSTDIQPMIATVDDAQSDLSELISRMGSAKGRFDSSMGGFTPDKIGVDLNTITSITVSSADIANVVSSEKSQFSDLESRIGGFITRAGG